MDKPEQNVGNFGNKMAKMACWINGTGSAPIDLSTLLATSFIDCEVLAFQMKAKGIHDLVYNNPKELSADEIIWTLKTKLWSLKSQGLWSRYKGKKLNTEGDLAGLNLAMDNILKS